MKTLKGCVWSGTYGDGDAVIVEDEVHASSPFDMVTMQAKGDERRDVARYAAAAETKSVNTKRAP